MSGWIPRTFQRIRVLFERNRKKVFDHANDNCVTPWYQSSGRKKSTNTSTEKNDMSLAKYFQNIFITHTIKMVF